MGPGYLLDTNVIIDFSALKLPEKAYRQLSIIIDSSPQISIINKIELLSISDVPEQILVFVDEANVIKLDDDIVSKTIEVRRKYKLKLPDAIIAATAIVMELQLITRNAADFRGIKGLKLIDPYTI
jgi:predicted nucleic acid-binding protein